MNYVFMWFVIAIPCYFYMYCNGADLNFRMDSIKGEYGFWKFHKNFFREGFHLFVHDFFGVYCPWSWERAKRYRLEDMRIYLGADGRDHEHLGHVTAADCDDPEKQETIARQAFISRTKHWGISAREFVFAPLFILAFIVFIIAALLSDLSDLLSGK